VNSLKQYLASKSPENVEELERVKAWLRTSTPPAEDPAQLLTVQWLPLSVEPFVGKHGKLGKLSREEFDEYRRSQHNHESANLGYLKSWGRPTFETAESVWQLLAKRLYKLAPEAPRAPRKRPPKDQWKEWDGTWQPWCGPFPNPNNADDQKLVEHQEIVTKQAALISILCAINCGLTGKMLTQTKLVEELARYFSDHWRFMEKALDRRVSWNDITPGTQEGAWRDLVRNQVCIERLWYLVTQLIPGQFPDDAHMYDVALDRKANGGYSVMLDGQSELLKEFAGKVSSDPGCRRPVYRHRIVPAAEDMNTKRERFHVAGERPYNRVDYGQRSFDLLDALDSTTLLFDTRAFIARYDESQTVCQLVASELFQRGIKAWRLPSGDFKRRLDAACRQLAGWAEKDEAEQHTIRTEIEPLLKQHDRRHDFLVAYRGVHETVVRHGGRWQQGADMLMGAESDQLMEIQTRWYKTLNGRYQTASLWPLSVTSKKLAKQTDLATFADVIETEGPRRDWFRIPGQPGVDDGKPQRLVGLDVVASQYQLYSLILGISELEEVVFQPGFRALLVEKVKPFVRAEDYPEDDPAAQERLKTLVKTLNMVDGYDAQTHETVRDMRRDPEAFGPGFSTEGCWKGGEQKMATLRAKEYLASVPGHPHIEKFRLACRRIATVAYQGRRKPTNRRLKALSAKLRYRGVSFVNPWDGSVVRWNPTRRVREASRWGSVQATYSPPGSRMINEEGRVWREAFREDEAAELRALSYLPGTPIYKEPRKRSDTTKWRVIGEKKDRGLYGPILGEHPWKRVKRSYWKHWTTLYPTEKNPAGDYPVDVSAMRRAVAPCTIHVTDALFSGLVMERLTKRGVTVIGFHDAWCVGEWVSDGFGGQVPGEALLRQVIEEVGEEWLTSLKPVYDFLDKYLRKDKSPMPDVIGEDPETRGESYSAYVQRLRQQWEDRVSECRVTGNWPRFHVDRSR